MGVRLRMRLLLIAALLTMLQITPVFAEQSRSGRLVTLDNKEIGFEGILNRDMVKGWWNGSAIMVPLKTVAEVTFSETPKSDYSIIGNKIKTGSISLTRLTDKRTFVLTEAFLPSDCNCSYLTYTS